jgi:phosphohistidine phosphatase SixA
VASDLIEPATVAAARGSRFDMLLVVRHADAGDKRGWTSPDALRPLSSAGRRQAEGLVVRLEDYPVERILCSPTLRCHETVQPLAHDRFLEIEHVTALGVEATPAQLLTLLATEDLGNAVLCTHGELIGRLLAELVADGLAVEEPLDWPKGSTWLLERADRRPVRGRLLAPLVLDDPEIRFQLRHYIHQLNFVATLRARGC